MSGKDKRRISLFAREWFARAWDDERSAAALLKKRLGAPAIVCFLLQQAAEKYLKGFIVQRGGRFLKIHQLGSLLRLCAKFDPEFALFKKEAKFLNGFYVTARYPGDYPPFSWPQATEAFAAAEKIKNFIHQRL